jgi:hypothetical protein
MVTVDVSSLHAGACHIEREIRLDLAPIDLFLSIFLLFPRIWDLGFTLLLFSDPEEMQVF